jgi:hypothetical protein
MTTRSFSYRVLPARPPKPPAVPYRDLTGLRFGNLVVLGFLYCRHKKAWWNCVCDCGGKCNQVVVRGDKLTCGQTRCCSCRMAYAQAPKTPPLKARPARLGTTQDGVMVLSAPYVPPPRRVYTAEELAAAEMLSARQMMERRAPLSEIAAYLGCDTATAKQRLAAGGSSQESEVSGQTSRPPMTLPTDD